MQRRKLNGYKLKWKVSKGRRGMGIRVSGSSLKVAYRRHTKRKRSIGRESLGIIG